MSWFSRGPKPIQMDRDESLSAFIVRAMVSGDLKHRYNPDWGHRWASGLFRGERGFNETIEIVRGAFSRMSYQDCIHWVLREAYERYQHHLYREETLDALANDVTSKRSLDA